MILEKSGGRNIGARIKALRLAKGLRRADVARDAGISYDYLAKIENDRRNPNVGILGRVLGALGSSLDEFFGALSDFEVPPPHGPPFPLERWGLMRLGEARPVSLIGWTQAGWWSPAMENIEYEGEESVWSDAASAGCFALTVKGLSMEPEFSPGDVIIVDPGARPEPGDFVVALVEPEAEATFKQYLVKEGRPVLHALNPAYPDIPVEGNIGIKIVGVVMESKRIFPVPDNRAAAMARVLSQLEEMSDDELEALAESFGKK